MIGKKFSTIFWPLLLIGLGVLWLMVNLDLLQPQVLQTFVSLWPLLLIAIGLHLLLKPRYPGLGAWIAVITLVLAFGLALAAPGLGWTLGPELKQIQYSEPRDGAESARVTLDLSIGTTNISTAAPGGALIEADISYYNDTELEIEGEAQKTVHLTINNEGVYAKPFSIFSDFSGNDPRAEIKLSPDVPLDLVINGAVGQVELDLSGLTLNSLVVNGGVGDISMVLPGQSEHYTARINGGVGRMRITVEEGANVMLDVSGGVGDFNIDVPADAPVRLDGEAEVGTIRVASFMELVSERERTVGRSGVWESPQFASAEARIEIEFQGGVGSLTVR